MHQCTLLVIASILLVAGCTADRQIAERQPATAVAGSVVSNPFEYGKSRIPLPEGEWLLASESARDVQLLGSYSHLKSVNGGVAIVELKGKKLTRLVGIQTVLESPSRLTNWARYFHCSNDELLYRRTIIDQDGGPQDCWWVKSFRMKSSPDSHQYFKELFPFLSERETIIPHHMLYVAHRFASVGSGSTFLNVFYMWNPETFGFPSSRSQSPSGGWDKNAVYTDPEKLALVERLKIWGARWHETVKAGFENLTTDPLAGDCTDPQTAAYIASDCAEWLKVYKGEIFDLEPLSETKLPEPETVSDADVNPFLSDKPV